MSLREYLKGKDRKQFASELGMSPGYLAQLAARIRLPSGKLALKIAKATNYQVSVEDLISGNGPPTPVDCSDDQSTAASRAVGN
jgi:transcriptional regulator with XRE-family HTH domain